MSPVARRTPDLDLGIREEWLLPAAEPAEARGGGRDDVRLLVQDLGSGAHGHGHFRDLPALLRPGDLLVVNRSRTLPASLPVQADRGRLRVHVARRLARGVYRVEVRSEDGTAPTDPPPPGARFRLETPEGRRLCLEVTGLASPRSRQVVVRTVPRASLMPWMLRLGDPIRYAHVPGRWPLAAYQTIFAGPAGSAEMPSAARPFTPRLLGDLRRRGVGLAVVTLHCGLSSEEVVGSLDEHELFPEPYVVPPATARAIAKTRAGGGRVVAVGTTVVRALESACAGGVVSAGRGDAGAVLRPGVRPCAVDGLITGLHAPRSSHLALLEAFIAPGPLRAAYLDAVARGYLWHEFGDVHLLLQRAVTATAAVCWTRR